MKVRGFGICVFDCLILGFLAACFPAPEPTKTLEQPVDLPAQSAPTSTPPAVPTLEPTATAGPVVRSIKAGWGFTLALMDNGAVKCWGFGYVCDGSTVNKSTPVDKQELNGGVAAIAAGGGHACALMEGGAVKCWGANNDGQLGNDTRADSSAPVDVVGLGSGVVAIAVGGSHTCGLTAGGGVKCWGDNGYGELGDGTHNLSRTPVDVIGLFSGVVAIAAGGSHTCAVMDTGGVKCWGDNGDGELGNNDTDSPEGRYHSTPADVEGLTDAVEVAAGFNTTCARTNRGGVKCWGYRENGQLGDGVLPETQKERHPNPVDVFGLGEGVSSIVVGGGTACALTVAGSVLCWGSSTGADDPTAQNMSFVPVNVSGFASGVAAVTAGDRHNCVLTGSGTVKCWGFNNFGELGDGTEVNSPLPVDVIGLA